MTKKHVLIMVLCCLIPLIGYAAVSLLGIRINAILFCGMVFICPVLHLILMLNLKRHIYDDRPHSPAGVENRSGEESGLATGQVIVRTER